MIVSREQRRKNRELKKQLEAEKTKNAVLNDGVDKDAEIEALKREVFEWKKKANDTRYCLTMDIALELERSKIPCANWVIRSVASTALQSRHLLEFFSSTFIGFRLWIKNACNNNLLLSREFV